MSNATQGMAKSDVVPKETWELTKVYAVRRFKLVRKVDVSGVSGTGHVADGVIFHDGTTVVHWRTEHTSTIVFATYSDMIAIHGHGGSTEVEWVD